jgi:putative ABC transport system substrate-binding protein
VQDAARSYGKRVIVLQAAEDRDFDAAFETLTRQGAEALLVGSDPFFSSRKQKLVELAARHAVPAIYEWRDFPEVGGLVSYGTSLAAAYRQVGVYVGRILKGERPADLPVAQSTKFELVVNLKTAASLGLDVSPLLLAQADEIIE